MSCSVQKSIKYFINIHKNIKINQIFQYFVAQVLVSITTWHLLGIEFTSLCNVSAGICCHWFEEVLVCV